MEKRNHYGVTLFTDAGPMTLKYASRAEAQRVRRTIAMWLKQGNGNHWRTLQDIAILARERKGVHSDEIICEYRRQKGS